jgi:two-component system, chemotaxis family, protein-glutamate methylesterase/glutaminase
VTVRAVRYTLDGAQVDLRYRAAIIAASAGGLGALSVVLGSLRPDFPLPIVIVQHIHPHHASQLASILSRRTGLAVKEAAQHDVLIAGNVYVAPPDFHAEFLGGSILLTHTPQVHFVRPSADRSFVSGAREGRVIGVVLTGAGVDGADGVVAIKAAGGIVIAQDRVTAEHFGMPRAAIETGAVDYILPVGEIGPALTALSRTIE